MRNVPTCFEGTLVFKNKGEDKLRSLNLNKNAEAFQNVEKVLIDDIAKPIMVDMVLEYNYDANPASMVTAEAYEDAKVLLALMKAKVKGQHVFNQPLIVQFTMIDPSTKKTVLLTTNLDNTFDAKDKSKVDPDSLVIRDVTIKSNILST